MALSENQNQLAKHGSAVLGGARISWRRPVRSIALWSRANCAAADYCERELGDAYLRVRFEDLCAEPTETVAAILGLFGLEGDAERMAEAVRPPVTRRVGGRRAAGLVEGCDLRLAQLGVCGHRPELEDPELRLVGATAYLWKRNGPGESSLIKTAMSPNSGTSGMRQRSENARSSARFEDFIERDSRSGKTSISGRPSAVWIPTFVPSTSNSLGTMSIWTPMSLIDLIRSSSSSCESSENANTTRSTSSTRAGFGKLVRRAEFVGSRARVASLWGSRQRSQAG